MANCKYCGKKIVWMKEGRKNVPCEEDGIKHECEEYKNTIGSVRDVELSEMDPAELEKIYAGLKKNVQKTKEIKKRKKQYE